MQIDRDDGLAATSHRDIAVPVTSAVVLDCRFQ
jgi:hypothetical protein